MTRRVVMAAVLALAVVLAGCQFGGTGTGLPSETVDGTPASPFDRASAPPGVDGSGVSDADALLSAHSSTMNGTPATVDVQFRLTVNGTGQNVSLRGKSVPDSDRGWMQVDLQNGSGAYYTDGGTTYYREIVDANVDYGTTDGISAVPDRPRFGADERVRTAVESAEWEPVGTVERGGRTLYELRATSVDPPNVNTSGDTTVSSSGRLLVDSAGVVHHVEVSTTVENDRGTVQYGLSVGLSEIGSTTIEEPDWVDLAAED